MLCRSPANTWHMQDREPTDHPLWWMRKLQCTNWLWIGLSRFKIASADQAFPTIFKKKWINQHSYFPFHQQFSKTSSCRQEMYSVALIFFWLFSRQPRHLLGGKLRTSSYIGNSVFCNKIPESKTGKLKTSLGIPHLAKIFINSPITLARVIKPRCTISRYLVKIIHDV